MGHGSHSFTRWLGSKNSRCDDLYCFSSHSCQLDLDLVVELGVSNSSSRKFSCFTAHME